MHTIEEANHLWCPMVRLTVITTVDRVSGFNAADSARIPSGSTCIAKKCAMWRWDTYMAPPENAEPGKLYVSVAHQGNTGYCGLAGSAVR